MSDATTPTHAFSFGDRVVHPAKPEWGVGTVSKARNVVHEGVQCQALTIRFERAGLKTLNTAFADLKPEAEHHPAAPQPDIIPDDDATAPTAPRPRDAPDAPATNFAKAERSWLDEAAALPPDKAMARLPEECSDPFASLADRVEATLKQYRFTPAGASLLDWAAAQTGLADPLSRFARHELEQFFRRYADTRDNHLVTVASELRRKDPAAFDRLAAAAPANAKPALRRAHAGR